MTIDASTGLAPVRELLQPDGADVELIGVDGTTARLRLVLESVECTTNCVMPRQMIEMVALQLMQPLVPGLTAVTVEDPRDA
jgi:hypothetical protein